MRRKGILIAFLTMLGLAVVMTSPGVVAQTGSAATVNLKAISFPQDKQVVVPLKGSPKSPEANGQANVEPAEKGLFEIEINGHDMKPPSTFGPEFLVYVLWSVTPEGQVSNLGALRVNGNKYETRATTRLQSFAIAVTAEPYYAVKKPSDTVVLINGVPDKKYIQTDPLDLKTELLERARYKDAGLKPTKMEPGVPTELYQARNAVQIARWQKAPEFAKETYDKAVKSLNEAEAGQKAKKPDTNAVVSAAREAVQFSEDARNVANTREEEARLAAERKAAADREAAAKDAASKNAGERDAAMAQNAAAKAEVEKRRAALLAQLNAVLATQDTDRGLVATMADVTFATNSAELKPEARETLAKLAGIVSLLPKLEFVIEGYTDNQGGDDHNLSLSEQRAKSVRDYLVSQGIASTAIKSKGLGKASPVADNSTNDGRAKNRRVEIVVGGEVIGTKFGG